MKKLPTSITPHPDASFAVELAPVTDGLGYLDAHNSKMVIDPDQPVPEQWIIFFHELLHLVEAGLLETGMIKRHIPHNFITGGAPVLFGTLAMSGLLKGINPDEAKQIVRRWIAEPPQ